MERRSLPFAWLGVVSLLGIGVLAAVAPALKASDRAALLLLGLAACLLWLPVARRLVESREAATWVLLLTMAVVYSVARRAGPQEGWHLPISEDVLRPVVIPFSARVVLLGALLSSPAWARNLIAPLKALLAAVVLISSLALVSFGYLRPFYAVGEVPLSERPNLNPGPLVETLLQSVEYAALGLCCAAATAHPLTRRLTLRALPLLLLLWARHTFKPIAPPVDPDDL